MSVSLDGSDFCETPLLLCSGATANNAIISSGLRPRPHSFTLSSQTCSQCVGVIGGPSCTSSCCWSFKPQQPLHKLILVCTHTHKHMHAHIWFNLWETYLYICYLSSHSEKIGVCVCVCVFSTLSLCLGYGGWSDSRWGHHSIQPMVWDHWTTVCEVRVTFRHHLWYVCYYKMSAATLAGETTKFIQETWISFNDGVISWKKKVKKKKSENT